MMDINNNHINIKKEVIEQLKKEFPNWKRLPKKMKKDLSFKFDYVAIP